jgi:hypothetical protein
MPVSSEPPSEGPLDGNPRPDLDLLVSDLSLATLPPRGWMLDRLPTASLASAFAAALTTTTLAFGAIAGAPVILATLAALLLAGSAVLMRDLAAARATLQVARVGLLVWLVVSAVFL